MKIKPLRDYILVELVPEPTISPGGIILLPPREEPRQSIGNVLAVGPGARDKKAKRQPLAVKIGDRVAFSKYGHKTPPGQPNWRLFREGSVHGIVD